MLNYSNSDFLQGILYCMKNKMLTNLFYQKAVQDMIPNFADLCDMTLGEEDAQRKGYISKKI